MKSYTTLNSVIRDGERTLSDVPIRQKKQSQWSENRSIAARISHCNVLKTGDMRAWKAELTRTL